MNSLTIMLCGTRTCDDKDILQHQIISATSNYWHFAASRTSMRYLHFIPNGHIKTNTFLLPAKKCVCSVWKTKNIHITVVILFNNYFVYLPL